MIANVNQEQFLVELKQARCFADWHRLYYEERARKYHRIDFWVKGFIGLFALVGAALVAKPEYRLIGAILAAGCAFLTANILPVFKWESIVSGFKSEEKEWTRIFQGYEHILSSYEIANREEMLIQELQRVKEMQRAAALNDLALPKDQKLLDGLEERVRKFYDLDGNQPESW